MKVKWITKGITVFLIGVLLTFTNLQTAKAETYIVNDFLRYVSLRSSIGRYRWDQAHHGTWYHQELINIRDESTTIPRLLPATLQTWYTQTVSPYSSTDGGTLPQNIPETPAALVPASYDRIAWRSPNMTPRPGPTDVRVTTTARMRITFQGGSLEGLRGTVQVGLTWVEVFPVENVMEFLITTWTDPDGVTLHSNVKVTPGGPDNSYSYTMPPGHDREETAIGYANIWGPERGYASPTITNNPDITYDIGDTIDWIAGITARWGRSTHRTIPAEGEVRNLPINSVNMLAVANASNQANRIGAGIHHYEVRDTHSLDTTVPGEYQYDTTMTPTSRKISVRTHLAPHLIYKYGSDSVHHGATYASTGTQPCGGEEGWTNQALDISLDPHTIVGSFDSVLSLPDLNTTQSNGIATRTNYHIESPNTLGTAVSGVLTEIGTPSNPLSNVVSGSVKIDRTNPIPNAIHNGSFSFTDDSEDDLSGISISRPSKIAFSPVNGAQPALSEFTIFEAIPSMTQGYYDVWVWATDKAGNEEILMVQANVYLSGGVEMSKDTLEGATLHHAACTNIDDISTGACVLGCSDGANIEIEERSSLTYVLTISNTDSSNAVTGSFEDYLPLGSVISTLPTATPAGAVSNLAYELQSSGAHTGQYKVTGNYDLAANEQVEIKIQSQAPAFDQVVPANNIIRNQASLTWVTGSHNGEILSNHALHELTGMLGVETSFTKVSADDLSMRLAGAEFALYRWEGSTLTDAEKKHMVDTTLLTDDANNTLSAAWVRVTYDGEIATSLSDIFISSTSAPIGEVDFGTLEEGIYTLIETKAPAGYEKPNGQWVLTIDPSKDDSGAGAYKIEFTGKSHSIMPPAAVRNIDAAEPTYQIINARPFSIGLSGLGGSTGILLAGFIIMALAGNTYIVLSHKRKSR